jgi:dolichyl-phosphate-mannose--protein O-mannosyl transferase
MGAGNDMILSLLPFLILSIPLLWGIYLLASRTERSGALYIVLTLIPVIGVVATIYLFYSSILFAIDRSKSSPPPFPSRQTA